MISKIILGISTVQLIFSFFQYMLLKKSIASLRRDEVVDHQDKQMSQIENDLNTRLREIQTAQFSPRMGTPVIRLVQNRGDD